MFHWGTAKGLGIGQALLPHCEPGLGEGVEGGPGPVGTAAGVRLLGEAGRDDPNRLGCQAEGGPQGDWLQEGACLGAPRGVKGAGEVGQRYEEGQEGGRLHGG